MAKMRSPNYPAVGLSQAITAAGKLWKEEKRTAVSQPVAAQAIGFKGMNGPARITLSAMKKYGLLEGRGDAVKLSDLAVTILHSESDSEQRMEAVRKAALRPQLFRELYESHREASENAITSYLMVQKSFSDAGARQCSAAFRDTLAVADLKASGYSPEEEEEQEDMEEDASLANPGRKPPPPPPPGTRVYSYPLEGVGLEIRVTGQIKPSQRALVEQYFELVKAALKADSAQE